MPTDKEKRFINDYKLRLQDAIILAKDNKIANYFEDLVNESRLDIRASSENIANTEIYIDGNLIAVLEGVASNAITAEDFISLDYDLSELIDQTSSSQNIDLNLLNKLDQEDSSDDPSEDDSQDKPADDTDDDLPTFNVASPDYMPPADNESPSYPPPPEC